MQCQYKIKKSDRYLGKYKEQCSEQSDINSKFCNKHKFENRKIEAVCEKCLHEQIYGTTSFKSKTKCCQLCYGRMINIKNLNK